MILVDLSILLHASQKKKSECAFNFGPGSTKLCEGKWRLPSRDASSPYDCCTALLGGVSGLQHRSTWSLRHEIHIFCFSVCILFVPLMFPYKSVQSCSFYATHSYILRYTHILCNCNYIYIYIRIYNVLYYSFRQTYIYICVCVHM